MDKEIFIYFNNGRVFKTTKSAYTATERGVVVTGDFVEELEGIVRHLEIPWKSILYVEFKTS